MSSPLRCLRRAKLGAAALLLGACQLIVPPSGGRETDEAGAGAEERACGERTCAEGSVCCNASCGICTAPGNVCIQIACEPGTTDESCTSLTCDADELCMETPAGPQCVPQEENPCALVTCRPNSLCRVEQGAATCVPLSGEGDAGQPTPRDGGGSAPTDAGTSPVEDAATPLDAATPKHDGGPKPPKDSGLIPVPITCATVLCPADTYCDDLDGTAQCIPLPSCKTVKCAAGHHCELEQVVCVRAPCPPLPTCVPDRDPPDPCGGKCKSSARCLPIQVQCITAPCEPVYQCVPDRPCGCGSTGKVGAPCLDIICPVNEAS